MIEQQWPAGVQPKTATPTISVSGTKVRLSCSTQGASVAYQVVLEGQKSTENWLLYVDDLDLPSGGVLMSKAVRIGFKESEVVSRNFTK